MGIWTHRHTLYMYVLVTAKSSFYEFSTKPIPVYTYYRSVLYYMYGYLFILFFSMGFFYETYDKVPNTFVFSVPLHGLFNSMRSKIRIHDSQYFGWYHGSSGVEMNWFIIFSILRFIFSFLLFELRKYTFWRLVLYIFVTVIHALMVTYIFYVFCSNRVDFFSFCKEQSKFFENIVVWWTFIQWIKCEWV